MNRLKFIRKKNSGRDASGQVSVRHQGGEQKRFMRVIDFKRNKIGIEGVLTYDPSGILIVLYLKLSVIL